MFGLSLQDWAAVASITVAVVGMVRGTPVETRPTTKTRIGSSAVRSLRSTRRRVRRASDERQKVAA